MVSDLAVNAQQTVIIPWTKDQVPGPGHYCFYVRLLNDADPMKFPEGTNAERNTSNNNNIAWRNFDIVGLTTKVTDQYQVTVQNPNPKPANVDLAFNEPEHLLQNEGTRLVVDLGPLFDRWQAAGGQGENIKPIEGTTLIELTDTPAKIIGIPMDGEEESPITVQTSAYEPVPEAGTSHEYHFSIQEYVDGELVGGVDSTIVTRAQDTDTDGDGASDITDADDDNDGISDEWEAQNDLNPLDTVDATEDTDNDGYSNLEEYASNTNPASAISHPGTPWAMTMTAGFDKADTSICALLPETWIVDQNEDTVKSVRTG